MVAGRLRVLAVVEAVGPGRGGGVSLDLAQMAASEVARVGEDRNGGRRREGAREEGCRGRDRVSPELRRVPTAPRRWAVADGGGGR
jgi:hypothetical protein